MSGRGFARAFHGVIGVFCGTHHRSRGFITVILVFKVATPSTCYVRSARTSAVDLNITRGPRKEPGRFMKELAEFLKQEVIPTGAAVMPGH